MDNRILLDTGVDPDDDCHDVDDRIEVLISEIAERDDYITELRARIAELEMLLNGERIATHAAQVSLAHVSGEYERQIAELETQRGGDGGTDNGTLPEDPRETMWRDDAIAILALHGWQTPQRLSNGEIEHIMHTDARNFDEYRAAIYGYPVKYRWLDDRCIWVDAVGDPVLAKDWQQWRLDNAELVEASE